MLDLYHVNRNLVIITQQPTYLLNLLYLSDRFRTFGSSVGKRAFSVAVPTIWNQLPIMMKSSETIDTFCKKLKTYLFEIAFPPYKFVSSML